MSLLLPDLVVLGASAVAVSHTGNTSETALATVSTPANYMNLNGWIEILSLWSFTNNANNKTNRIRWNGAAGTVFMSDVVTTEQTRQILTAIRNRNSASSQVGAPAAFIGLGSGAAGVVTAAINTASAVDIVFTTQLANGADTATLEAYRVLLYPRL